MYMYNVLPLWESASVEGVCKCLFKSVPGIDDAIIEYFRKHNIDGAVFVQLTDKYLREIAFFWVIGSRSKCILECLHERTFV